jgi:hypothetical protein
MKTYSSIFYSYSLDMPQNSIQNKQFPSLLFLLACYLIVKLKLNLKIKKLSPQFFFRFWISYV